MENKRLGRMEDFARSHPPYSCVMLKRVCEFFLLKKKPRKEEYFVY